MSTYEEHQRAKAHHQATVLHSKAFKEIKELNRLVEARPHEPWSDDIKKVRDRAREYLLAIVFNFASSPLAQCVNEIWIHTTHTYLKSTTAEAACAKADLQVWYRDHTEQLPGLEVRLWNAWSQYRIIIKDDVAFYKNLIDRLVRYYKLHHFVGDTLESIDIPISHEASEDGDLPSDFTDVERQGPQLMVYETIIYLGDLERYSCQLDDIEYAVDAPRNPNVEPVARGPTAQDYYQAAVVLGPENGHAYNALAILYHSQNHPLKEIYYFLRAYAIRRPFRKIDETIEKDAKRRTIAWSGRRDDGAKSDYIIYQYLDAIDMINCQQRLKEAASLTSGAAYDLPDALAERLFPADTLVKLTVCLIATHYRARQVASGKGGNAGRDQSRQLAKETALAAITVFFRTLCEVAMWELAHYNAPSPEFVQYVDDATTTERGDTYSPDDKADTEGLALQLSSVMRRMLPTLRILSKWLKVNVPYLRRHVDRSKMGDMPGLWTKYTAFMTKIAETFPIHNLPSLMGSLEEDIELMGFMPLSRTLNHAKRFEAKNSCEEHLMRVSDLSIDAILIIQQAVEHKFVEPGVLEHLQDLHRQPSNGSVSSEAQPPSEPGNQEQGTQGDKTTSNNHIRQISQDDDDEEIVYTPPPQMAKASAQPKAVSASAAPAALAPAEAQSVTQQASATVPEPAVAPASAQPAAPQRAITAMDLVEQIGRRVQNPGPAPLEPPLAIESQAARDVGPPPGFSQPLVVKHAGPGPGFNIQRAGTSQQQLAKQPSGPSTGHGMQPYNNAHIHAAVRRPGPPPGFGFENRQPTGPPPGLRDFPPHVPAAQGLFGGPATMWTLSRAESEEGILRSLSQSSQPRPGQNGPNAPVPRVHSGSSLVGQDNFGFSNLSMSRSASQPSQSRPFPKNPRPLTRNPLLWPTDFRDHLYLLAGRNPPIHY